MPVGAQLGEVPQRGSFILPLRRYGIRRLRRSPTFSAAVITVPALGIGLTTAMFSTVDAVLLRPLPFGDPNRLVTINEIGVPFDNIVDSSKSAPDMLDTVAQRHGELGIRLALGADPLAVVRMVVGQGLGLALIGCLVGLAGAWMLARVMAGLLYGVAPQHPLTFAMAPIVLLVVAALASLLPAFRAASVDPAVIIKAE